MITTLQTFRRSSSNDVKLCQSRFNLNGVGRDRQRRSLSHSSFFLSEFSSSSLLLSFSLALSRSLSLSLALSCSLSHSLALSRSLSLSLALSRSLSLSLALSLSLPFGNDQASTDQSLDTCWVFFCTANNAAAERDMEGERGERAERERERKRESGGTERLRG